MTLEDYRQRGSSESLPPVKLRARNVSEVLIEAMSSMSTPVRGFGDLEACTSLSRTDLNCYSLDGVSAVFKGMVDFGVIE